MNRKKYLKLCVVILLVAIIIFLSYKYLDKAAAYFVNQLLLGDNLPGVASWLSSYKSLLNIIIQSDDYIYNSSKIVMALCLLMPVKLKRSSLTQGFAITSISVILTYLFKNALKSFFGRCCTYVVKKNSVLIFNTILQDKNALFFHFLKGAGKTALFPSGHMAITCSLVTSLCIYFPRLKFLWIFIAFLMGLSLIITNNHFVSDVLAGALLGFLVAYLTFRLFTIELQ